MKNNKVSFLLNMASPSVGAIFKLQYYVSQRYISANDIQTFAVNLTPLYWSLPFKNEGALPLRV